MRLTCTLILISCLAAWAPALAQAPAAGQQEQPAEQAKPEKQPKPKTLMLSVGGATWGLSGNTTKFQQYATPPKGLYIPELLYNPLPSPDGYQGGIVLRGLFQQDHYIEGMLDFLWGTSRIEGWQQRNQYFDPTVFAEPASAQQWSQGSFRQLLGQSWGLSLNYRMDEQSWIREAPRDPLHQRTAYSSGIAQGRLGPGSLQLLATQWRYWDRTLILPDTQVSRLQASYLVNPVRWLGIEGLYARSDISQPGLPNSAIETIALGGDLALGSNTDVEMRYQRDNLDYPNMLSAAARRQRMGSIRLIHRLHNWTAQVGARQREVVLERADQSFVDVPRWWTVDARLSGRLTSNVRLTLRGWHENMVNRPPVTTEDTRPSYWSNRTFGQMKLEGGWGPATGYLVGTYRRMDNGDRSTAVTNRNVTVGGNWDINPRISAFAEYAFDSWSGQSELTEFPTLANFMPDSRVATLGANWAVTPRASLWAGYTDYATSNDNPLMLANGNVRGHYLSLTARYLFPSGSQLGLTFAPWTYRDKVVSQMDYDTAVVMVTGSSRF